jgi:hypothetical protein
MDSGSGLAGMTLYLAVVSYPYEGGYILGVYSTEQLACEAIDAWDGPRGYDSETRAVTVDCLTDISV